MSALDVHARLNKHYEACRLNDMELPRYLNIDVHCVRTQTYCIEVIIGIWHVWDDVIILGRSRFSLQTSKVCKVYVTYYCFICKNRIHFIIAFMLFVQWLLLLPIAAESLFPSVKKTAFGSRPGCLIHVVCSNFKLCNSFHVLSCNIYILCISAYYNVMFDMYHS